NETSVAEGGKLHAVFTALGLRPTFRYEKFRSEWSDGSGHVVVDETPIGNFAEIEGPPRWIDDTAKQLGVRRAEYITQNYASLFLAWREAVKSKASEMTFAAVDAASVCGCTCHKRRGVVHVVACCDRPHEQFIPRAGNRLPPPP